MKIKYISENIKYISENIKYIGAGIVGLGIVALLVFKSAEEINDVFLDQPQIENNCDDCNKKRLEIRIDSVDAANNSISVDSVSR